jgi:hypothetical protein
MAAEACDRGSSHYRVDRKPRKRKEITGKISLRPTPSVLLLPDRSCLLSFLNISK